MPAFAIGTKTFFKQTNAPTGWTKQTANDDYQLRIISGATGGTVTNTLGFSTTLVDGTFTGSVSGETTTMQSVLADLPAHTHNTVVYSATPATNAYSPGTGEYYTTLAGAFPTSPNGPGGSGTTHNHPYVVTYSNSTVTSAKNFAVKYIDFILCTKA